MNDTRQPNKSRFRGPSSTTSTNFTVDANVEFAQVAWDTQQSPTSTSDNSVFHSPDDTQGGGDSMTDSNNHQPKYKNVQMSSHPYYRGVQSKHAKVSNWSGFWTLINSFALTVALILQGSILNYLLISFNDGRAEWYFFFFGDFVILVIFMFSIAFAWRFYKRHRKNATITDSNTNDLADATTSIAVDHVRVGSGIFGFSFPKSMGMLPLVYICWIIYAFNLVLKMYVFYSLNIPDSMVKENYTAPKEVILITLALSVGVFLFWIEAHWNLGDEHQRHLSKPSVDDLISHTAFELFDSLTFLDLITPDDEEERLKDEINISFTMKMIVLTFATVNFILPTLGLYRMSRTHFGEKTYGMIRMIDEETGKPSTRGLGVSIIYHLLRILAVNVPYMVIRIVLTSRDSKKELSIFIVKNILGILVSVRNLIPEVKQWLRITKLKSKLRSQSANGRDSSDGRIRVKLDPSGRFDPVTQTWELTTILEGRRIQVDTSSSQNATLGNGQSQFATSTTTESTAENEDLDTGTTTSSPSITFSSSSATKTNSHETNA